MSLHIFVYINQLTNPVLFQHKMGFYFINDCI